MPKGEAKEEVFQLVEITETIDPGVKSGVDRETATPSMFWLNSSPNVNVRRFWGQHISSKLWFFVASQCDFFVDSKVYPHIHQTMIFQRLTQGEGAWDLEAECLVQGLVEVTAER